MNIRSVDAPLISVVIPTYNRADLIMETLQSVFDQTYQNYELIVVDNCSTDNTMELMRPLEDQGKLRYIRHDRNYERSRSRNTGMHHANGDFLTFLDSDDFMYETCLEDAASYIQSNPEIKFFQNLYELVNDRREPIYRYTFPSLKNQYLALVNGNFISCIGGFLHKDVYKSISFDEDPKMIGTEDYDVWFKVLARYKMGRINKINCGIREHVNRSVNNGAYENLAYQCQKVIENIKNDPITFDRFRDYLPRLRASFCMQQAIISNQLRNKGKALKLLRQAVKDSSAILTDLRIYKILFNIIRS